MSQSRLHIVPLDLDEANLLVEKWHRHHGPARGHKFSQGVVDEAGEIRGAAITGRPVNRINQDGWTLEVTRVVTDGCPNACSCLYAASWRATVALGFRRLITYTGKHESGSSLLAAGFRIVGEVKARSWDTPCRPRVTKEATLFDKWRWEQTA